MDGDSQEERLLERIRELENENELLRRENKKFSSAVQYSPATIVVTNKKGKIEYANPGFTKITGYSAEEALGGTPSLLKSGFHDAEFYHNLWKTISSGEVWQGVFYNRKKNGEYYWEQAHIAPIKDDYGIITNYVAIKFDITKKIENEQYLKTITSAIPELIFVMDEEGRYIDVLVGEDAEIQYVKDKYTGKLVHEVLPFDLADKLKEFITLTISTKSKQLIEYEIGTPSGMAWFEGRSAPLGIRLNDKKCIIIAARDITDRKKIEYELLELNATKDKFFTIMAHDLRNPFGAILAFSEMLSESIVQNENSETSQIAKHIHTSAELTFDLLENLLQWARSQTGRIDFKPRKFILHEVVGNNLKLLESQAMNKQVILLDMVPKNMVVFADLNLTKTILRNLISNAIKYTPATGQVKVTANDMDDFIQINIADTGVGIPPEGLNKLFRIDSKYSTAGTNKEKGTGLGLILCKEFVELNGGKIWVTSEVDKGTEFSFTLPKRQV